MLADTRAPQHCSSHAHIWSAAARETRDVAHGAATAPQCAARHSRRLGATSPTSSLTHTASSSPQGARLAHHLAMPESAPTAACGFRLWRRSPPCDAPNLDPAPPGRPRARRRTARTPSHSTAATEQPRMGAAGSRRASRAVPSARSPPLARRTTRLGDVTPVVWRGAAREAPSTAVRLPSSPQSPAAAAAATTTTAHETPPQQTL